MVAPSPIPGRKGPSLWLNLSSWPSVPAFRGGGCCSPVRTRVLLPSGGEQRDWSWSRCCRGLGCDTQIFQSFPEIVAEAGPPRVVVTVKSHSVPDRVFVFLPDLGSLTPCPPTLPVLPSSPEPGEGAFAGFPKSPLGRAGSPRRTRSQRAGARS